MLPRERVCNTFQNKPVDRVPFSFWFHFLENEATVDALKHPALLDKSFEGHKRYIETVRPDFVKVMCDGLFLYPGENLSGIKTAKDLERIQPIDKNHPWVRAHVRHVQRVTGIDRELCYFYNVFSPSMLLRIFVGESIYLHLFQTERAALADALARMGEGLACMAQSIIDEGGADGIFYCVQNTDLAVISDEEYHEAITPSDKLVLDIANRAAPVGNILHICGFEGRRNHLQAWADYKAAAYNWATHVERVPLNEGKKIFGGCAVVGGFENTMNSLLYNGTKEQIQAFARGLVQQTGETGLVVAADCSLPFAIPMQHLLWVKQALEEAGHIL